MATTGQYARGMRRLLPLTLLALVVFQSSQPPAAGQAPGIRGFTADGATAQRTLEERYRAIPDPARMREHMRIMTAEPHVAGRPSSKKVAEYALAQFKAAGLNAVIEETEAYMPWPVERRLEMVAPVGKTMLIQEPPVPDENRALKIQRKLDAAAKRLATSICATPSCN